MGVKIISQGQKPNILLIITHDLGQRLGCYGKEINTPNIDSLANEGVKFSKSFCTAPQCSPSRASLMSGQYPHNHGLIGLAHKEFAWKMDNTVKTLPEYLKPAGYETHLFGLQHETTEPKTLGYQHIHGSGIGRPKAKPTTSELIDFLERYSQTSGRSPFFASVGFHEPHRPYPKVKESTDRTEEVSVPLYLPDKDGIRKDLVGLNELVYRVDEAIHDIELALTSNNLKGNTLFIFTTDHGVAMPRAKGACYDPGIEITLILQKPGIFEGGEDYKQLISNVDILPTLLDYLDIEPARKLDGRSFLPLLKGESYQQRDHLFVEMSWHDQYNPIRGIRTEGYKYLKNFGERPKVFLPGDIYYGAAGKEVREEFYSSARPEEELYDLNEDPLENNNLAGISDYRNVHETLKRKVDKWLEKTEDPILEGPIPPTREQWAWMEKKGIENYKPC